MSHLPHTCDNCLMYDQIKCGCKEQASPNYGGASFPFYSSLPVLHVNIGGLLGEEQAQEVA